MEKTQDKKELLGTAPIRGLLFRLALPTVAAQLINMLYNIVDRIYIGHIAEVGDLALTGVGVCMPLIMLVSAFAALVGSGGAPRASIFMGKGDMKSAERTLGACFGLQILVSLVLTVVLCTWNRDLLLAFGASENTIAYAAEYMSIYAIGTIFVQLTLGMNAFISAQGFTAVAMLSVMVGAAANIVLDPILIYGLQMGVGGAAVATVLSQALSCVWVIAFLCGKRTMLRLKRQNMIPTPTVVLPCVALGSATFIMQASESVISVCFNSSLLAYGGDIAVGAMTILTSVMQFAMLPMQGIAQGAQPILSYNYGAKNATRVVKTFRLLLISCLIYSFTLGMCVMFFPRAFAAMFTTDAALLGFTERVIRIYFGGIFFFGIQIACQMTFVSMGKALSSVTVAIVRKFVLLLPLIYLMPHLCNDATTGVYLAEPIADILAVTFTAILFSVQFRRAKRIMQDDTTAVAETDVHSK
jgi:putative MATE family efflux protein